MKTKVLDEYSRPIRVAADQYRYMGHFIDDQREWFPRVAYPWVTLSDSPIREFVGHSTFAEAKAHCKANRIDNPESKLEECFG